MIKKNKTKAQLLQEIKGLQQKIKNLTLNKKSKDLTENNQKHIDIFETSNIGIFQSTPSGKCINVNPAFAKMFGYDSPEEIISKVYNIGKDIYTHPEQRVKFKKLISEKGTVKDFEMQAHRKDGSIIWILANAHAVYDPKGNILYYEGTNTDITKQKETEFKLAESESDLKKAQAVSHVGSFKWFVKTDQLELSDEMFHIFGINKESFTGSLNDVVKNAIHPDDREKINKTNLTVIRDKETKPLEFRIVWPDKSIHTVRAEAGELILDENGNPSIATGIVQDITERKHTEDELKESQALYHSFIEQLPNPIFRKNSEGRYVLVNSQFCRIKGLDKEKFIGKTPKEVRANQIAKQGKNGQAIKYVDIGEDIHEKIMQNGKIIEEEEEYSLTNGTKQFLNVLRMPVFDSFGNVIGTQGIMFDITEHKMAEEKLSKSEAQLSNALEIARLGPWEYDVIKDEFTFNDHFYSIFRTSAEKMGGYKMSSADYSKRFIHPDDASIVKETILEAIETDDPDFNSKLECRVIFPDGNIGYVSTHFFIVKDDKGKTVKTFGVNQNITEQKKVEEALKESEERLRITLESTQIGIWDWNIKDDLWWATETYFKMLGYDPIKGPLDRSFWLEKAHPDDKEIVSNKINEILTGKNDQYNYEARIMHSDGHYRWVNVLGHVVKRGEKGKAERMLGVRIDITERKQTEKELRTTKEYLENLIQTANAIVVGLDINGNITVFNEAAETITGYSQNELKKKNWFEIITPKDRYPDVIIEFERLSKAGAPKTFENPILTKNGEERYITWQNSELFENGKVSGFISFGIDITERKQMEKSLRESEDRFRKLVQSVTDYIYTVKVKNGKAVSTIHGPGCVSVTGYTSEEFSKNSYLWFEIIFKDDREAVVEHTKKILKGEAVKPIEHKIIHKNGSIRWIRNTPVAQYNDKDQLIEYDGLISDITDRKIAEEEIKKLNLELEKRVQERTAELAFANKELEAFSYSVSHDLKAPLRAVSGFSEIALKEFNMKSNHDIKGYLEKINFASLKMASLIDDLLNLSKISQAEVNKMTFNICSISKSTIDELQSQYPERKVKFIQPKEIIINADVNLIKIAMYNLLGNAWKYTSKKSKAKIEFSMNVLDKKNIFFVKDNGDGFDMKYADKLFTPFQRLHSSSEFEGTGIGLAIVKRIITKHNGKIWVESKKGIGTTFFFTLN